MKIDKQPKVLAGKTQIAQQLGAKKRQHLLHAFQFQNDFVLYQYIEAICRAGVQALVQSMRRTLPRPQSSSTRRMKAWSGCTL